MTEPWIGDRTDLHPGVCTFAPDVGDPPCGAMATVHVLSESAIYGVVALPACDRHVRLARGAGPLIDEHPIGPGCAKDEGVWDEGGCQP